MFVPFISALLIPIAIIVDILTPESRLAGLSLLCVYFELQFGVKEHFKVSRIPYGALMSQPSLKEFQENYVIAGRNIPTDD